MEKKEDSGVEKKEVVVTACPVQAVVVYPDRAEVTNDPNRMARLLLLG